MSDLVAATSYCRGQQRAWHPSALATSLAAILQAGPFGQGPSRGVGCHRKINQFPFQHGIDLIAVAMPNINPREELLVYEYVRQRLRLSGVIVPLIAMCALALLWRIYCELLLVFFDMRDKLATIASRTTPP